MVSKYSSWKRLGAGLRRGRHQLRGVDLDVVALDPVGAERVFHRRLDAEDEVLLAVAQVEEAPVETLVERRVVGDRGLGDGGADDGQGADLDLEPAELDALVGLQGAGDVDEGAVRQARDRLGGGEGRGGGVVPLDGFTGGGVDQLDGAALVAEDDELHLLLIADGLDPSGHGDGAVGEACEVGDAGAFDHGRRVYRPGARVACRWRTRSGLRLSLHSNTARSVRPQGRPGGPPRLRQVPTVVVVARSREDTGRDS